MTSVLVVCRRAVGLVDTSVRDNPIVIKDFRTRMRGRKAFALMAGYVLLMGVVLLVAMSHLWKSKVSGAHSLPMNPVLGRDLFFWLNAAQAVLITLAIPSLTAGSLTQELEKKTMDLLALTPVSPFEIVFGKQISAFLYSLILLMCSFPVAAVCVALGGISPAEVVVTYLLVIAWAFMLASAGVMLSSLTRKMAVSTGANFGFGLIYFLLTLSYGADYAAGLAMTGSPIVRNPFALLNPAWAPFGALGRNAVCGVDVPLALVSFVINAALGASFLLVATTHVWRRSADMARPIRIMIICLSALTTWLAAGCLTIRGSSLMFWNAAGGACLTLLEMIVFAAVFTAGRIKTKPGEPVFNYALRWRNAFSADVGGAISFIMLWAVIDYAVFGFTVSWASGFGGADWATYMKLGVSRLAVIAGFCGTGVFASCLFHRRRNAIAMTLGIALVGVIGQVAESAIAHSVGADGPSVLAVLWPMTPVVYVTGHSFGGAPWWADIAWLLTSAVYVTVGYAALVFATPMLAKTGGVREEEN